MSNVTRTISEGVARVRKFVRTSGLTPAQIVRGAALSKNALRHLGNPKWQPRPETLDKLLNFIDAYEKKNKPRPSRSPVRAELLNA